MQTSDNILRSANADRSTHTLASRPSRLRCALRRILTAVASLLLIGIYGANAQTTTYVIMYDDNFLTHSTDGKTVNPNSTQTFNPTTCFWYVNDRRIQTANSSGTRISNNNYYLQAAQSGLGLGNSSQWRTASDGEELVSTRTGSYLFGYTYYYLRLNNSWSISSSDNYHATLFSTTINTENSLTPSLSINIDSDITNNGGIQLSPNVTGSYAPSCNKATVNGTTYYWTSNNNASTTRPGLITDWSDATVTWAVTTGGTYASVNSDGLVTITGTPTGNIVVRMTVTKGGFTTNNTATITLTRTAVSQKTNTTTTITGPTMSPSSAALYYNEGSQVFTASASATTTTVNTPAHTTLTGGGNTYYYYSGTLYSSTDGFSTSTESHPAVTLNWALSGAAASYLTRTPATGTSTTVTHSTQSPSDLTATLTVTASATGATNTTATATITAYGPIVAPTITCTGKTVSMSTTSTNATIYYTTTNGSTPTASSTQYTGPFDLTNSPTTVKAIAIRDGHSSAVTTETFKIKLPSPVITISNTGSATIALGEGSPAGTTIHYTTDGTTPTASSATYSTAVQLTNPQTIRAIAVKEGYDNSDVAAGDYVSQGTTTSQVIIDDREDHSWAYYNKELGSPIRSWNPADVKITYNGNGTTNVSKSNDANPANNSWTEKAENVKVSNATGEGQSTFIYLKTLERTDGQTADNPSGRCAYTMIPNPFSVRPTYGNGDTRWRGFYKWRITSIKNGKIYTAATGGTEKTAYSSGNLADANVLDADVTYYFEPTGEYGMEIVLEALWARAYVVTSNTTTGLNNNVSYERNFVYLSSSQTLRNAALSYPVTYTTVDPASGAGTKRTITIRDGFTCSADTKFENLTFAQYNNNDQTISGGDGKYLTIGRGVSGTINIVQGISSNATNTFNFRVESGTYNNLYFMGSSGVTTGHMTAVVGCDYDRVNGTNTNLKVNTDILMSNGGTAGSTNTIGTERIHCTVKSGNFDLGSYGGNVQFYMSSPGQNNYAKRTLVIEGGIFSDVSGGMENNATNVGDHMMFDLRIKGGTINGPTYGAAQNAAGGGHRKFIITGGQFKGWIAGGANGTNTTGGKLSGKTYIYFGGTASCNSNGSTTTYGPGNATGGNIFGAGSGNASAGNNATVGQVDQSTIVIADNSEVERNVYGGGNYGYVTGDGNDNKSDMYILGGTINGSVFGGSNMQKGNIVNYTIKGGTVKGGVYGGSNARGNLTGGVTMNISGGTMEGGVYGGGFGTNSESCDVAGVNITMTGGTVLTGLYGGGNVNSKVSGVTTINVNGGTIGASNNRANVHGGGLGSLTRILNSVVVNIGAQNATSGATIYGDVYGGSAEGKTNGNAAQENNSTTTVTLNAGTINGSLYGGGLGTQANAADVYGPVAVVVNGGSVTKPNDNPGSIFGCNNVNGSPKSTVTVTINGTGPTTLDSQNKKIYAINGVYGGGNLAHYNPSSTGKYPTVTVNGCKSSIKDVYGGGNAAAVPYTYVTINGGDIDRVFAGGNGESGTPAHVGYMNTNASPTGNGYGAGTTTAVIHGGSINQVFGGSNANGVIKDDINVAVDKDSECDINIGELYGGGNMAASKVGSVTIGCMGEGDIIDYVYGGSNDADITGNINLLIKGGRINNVFGGNNTGHSITGSITVTVDWSQGSCSYNYLGNVFGGGNLATIGTAQSPKAPTVNIYHGTVSGNVYGGGKGLDSDHTKGQITGDPIVNIGDNNNNHEVTINGDVYGGGDAGNVVGTPQVSVIDKANTTIGNVYGGGNAADVSGTDVKIQGGTIKHDVFGGGHGDKQLLGEGHSDKAANVTGASSVQVTGGIIDRVFAGSNLNGTIDGNMTLSINKSDVAKTPMKIGEVYGGANMADGRAASIDIGCTGTWTTTGDKNHTNANTTDNRIGYELEGIGYVYGGANQANIGTAQTASNITVGINSGIVANVFGGNNTSGTIYGTITVNIEKDNQSCSWYVGNVFGGGNLAAYTGSPAVNIKNGAVSGNVYGGGKGSSAVVTGEPLVTIGDTSNGHSAYVATVSGDVYGGGDAAAVTGNTHIVFGKANNSAAKLFGGGNAAGVSGTATVDLSAGSVTAGVYGGCNASGSVDGEINVNITGSSTVGSANTPANVHGGGYGDGTATAGDVNVNINGTNVNIYGDVYGGSGFGNVNNEITDATKVTLTAGKITGNIYGGGLGNAQYAALVNGTADVEINGGTVTGYIFGANNVNGTPLGAVTVTINGTDQPQNSYALGEVYGGGNMADYSPSVTTTPATVIVNGCDNSIEYVYGGGNAADVPATSVTIYGGKIGTVFGGGHGDKDAQPATEANVSGDVEVYIYGGTIGKVFGGSNSKGTISGDVDVVIEKNGSCAMKIGEVYGGGNEAAGNAGSVTIGCTGNIVTGENGHAAHPENIGTTLEGIGKVFGGANRADIGTSSDHSDITLNINSGMVANVFGGNNNGGTIYGDITVNIEQTSDGCGWYVGNVYGAGNLAPYSGTPEVYIKNGKVSLNVYGGGKGASAVVTGDPAVVIGDANNAYAAIVAGDVYGGGDAAAVTGNTSVTYNDANASSYVGRLFGGGNAAGVSGTSQVTLTSGKVNGVDHGGVFGGCNSSGSVGAVTLTLNGGTVGASDNTADVYGGGYGASTTTSAGITVNLNGSVVYGDLYGGSALGSVNAENAGNTTTVTLSTATLHGSVFGGGKGDNNTTATSEGNAIVNIEVYDQYLTGIYGGANVRGLVKGNINVNIKANVGSSGDGNSLDIFGGGYGAATNTNGSVTVTIGDEAGTYQPVIYGDIYGGSALGNVNDAAADITTVNFLNGTLHGNLYGGGLGDASNAAKVNGQVVVNISSSTQTVGNCHIDLRGVTIYGCNNTNGSPQDDVTVNIYKTAHLETNGGYAIDQVFGGGNQADYLPQNGDENSTKKTTVHIYGCDNTIRRVFAGGNAAAATGVASIINGGRFDDVFGGGNGEVTAANIGKGGTNLVVHGGSINRLFGGSNARGTITGQMGVSIDSEGGCDDEMFITEFFCGNNLANIGTVDGEPVTINATIGCGTKFGSVYGGCNLATIYGSVNLTIEGGEMEYVYGGSKGSNSQAANITGNVHLIIKGGDIDNVFGGSNINGNIGGSITVDIVKDPNPCKWDIGNVYGASNLAAYTPTSSSGNYPEVNVKNGTINGSVYGGGKGGTAVVTSNPKVTIGDNVAAHCVIITENVYGGGDAAAVEGNTSVTYNDNNSNSTVAKLFGGGNAANVSGTTTVTLTSGKVTGGVYGGCNSTGSVGAVTVALNGGTVGAQNLRADVYGGGFGSETTTTGNIGVTLGNTTVYGDIYGGSAMGKVNASTSNTTTVTISGTNLHGSVFGGGMGDANTKAVSNGNAIVNINAANAYTGIYGGANVNGLVNGNIELNINANIGASGNGNSLDVFGGGYGELTQTAGNVTVNVGNGSNTPAIYGAIYGGSALGSVNDAEADVTTVNVKSGTITGNIYGGGLGQAGAGNVAKGQVNGTVIVNIGSGTVNQQTGYATSTSGSATINGSVYGCNNTNGSPKANVTVNVYQTAHNATNAATYTGNDATYAIDQVFGGGNQADYMPTSTNSRATVHIYTCNNTIRRVFGGGNAAAAYGVVTTIDGGRFDNVFGGGNGEVTAANIDAGGTNLTIHGGNINQLFGGSNASGTITGQMGVNIDNEGGCEDEMFIAEFFCGNNLANIGTAENPVDINATIGCETNFGDVYGGCNLADIYGNVTLTVVGGTMNNVYGGSKGSASQAANINGNVTLNINGGEIGNAFGGSNINGNITGSILVNVEKNDDACIWSLGNVYGASNQATYTPTAQGNSLIVNIKKGTITNNVFGGGLGSTATATASPQVNLIGGTVTGNIFGGGAQAPVSGSPVVTANYGSVTNIYGGGLGNTAIVNGNPSVVISQTQGQTLTVTDVFGGGDAAAVTGNTTVTLTTGSANRAFGGGNKAAVSGSTTVNAQGATIANIYGGGNEAGAAQTNVNVSGGSVTTGVYGGSNSEGTITGAIAVSVTGGTIGSNATPANVHGGGYGHLTESEGNVSVTINGSGVNIYGDVYGGSALGNVNGSSSTTTVTLEDGTIHGSLYGGGLGQKNGVNGATSDIAALVNGSVTVTVNGGSVTGNIFGCNNLNGTPKGPVAVNINGSAATVVNGNNKTYALKAVYGGGNLAHYDPTDADNSYPTVTITGCETSVEDVYGGGNAAAVPRTYVVVNGGDINRVFAGGNGESGTPANVGYKNTDLTPSQDSYGPGTANAYIKGGSINEVFGGSNANGTIRVSGQLNIARPENGTCNLKITDLYGGGNRAAGAASAISIGCTGTNSGEGITNVYGGANAADVNGDISLTIQEGKIANIYGGNNETGSISGSITVTIDKKSDACTWSIGNVFGGGNLAQYTGNPAVIILNGTVSGNVYGGGKGLASDHTKGQVTGNPVVTIGDATRLNVDEVRAVVTGDVYGGGDAGNVVGTPVVNVINKCNTSIANVYGGGNAADVTGTDVNIDGGNITGMVFGGGHGDKASIGDGHSDAVANVGNGGVSVDITGGTINKVFGGSNTNGNITGNVAVNIDKGDNSCDLHITEVYGGGNLAAGNAGTLTIGCTGGAEEGIGDVYGGANQADINSDITLNITGGKINNVFGGNNTSGSINGSIAVNINWNGSCAQNSIQNVYGAGNLAQYSIPNGKALAVNVLNGTVSGNVYGGGKGDPDDHTKGQVTGNPVVTIGDATRLNVDEVRAVVTGDVYGGGDAGNVAGTPVVNVISKCNTSITNVYGGGNAADVNGTDVTIWGGTIGTVFGGGHGNAPSVAANVTGNVAVKIYGGTITEVFGGSNSMGNITGSSTVTIQEHQNSTCDMSITDVYGGGNQAAGNAGTLNIGCGAVITGNVYGGAKEANVNTDIHLVITGGNLNNVFGGNNVGGSIAGTITVDINQDNSCDTWHVNNVYGGGNLAAYTAPQAKPGYPVVNIMNGTISGNVFGGGLGSSAVVTANPHVNITGGTILGNIYGGGDAASVAGNTYIDVLGGTIGTSNNHSNIHGGGYGQYTNVSGNVTVNIGSVTGSGNSAVYSGSATIYGDVYGGSALGTVNTIHTSNTNGAYNKTAVNLYSGTIDGNVYGGGLGSSSVAALVYGDVDVFQYGVALVARYDQFNLPSSGMIFGCNNVNGTPKGHVKVGVYQTNGIADLSQVTTDLTGSQQRSSAQNRATHNESDHTYELAAVYGGGNRAAYEPDDLTNGSTEVFVNGCDEVSIHSVYGGGNAASTPATLVTIQGAHEIEYVFGGGNGAGLIDGNPNPGANVGYRAYPSSVSGPDQKDDREGYKYGSGLAQTHIYGGRIHKVFGGSNTRGNVREATVAMLDEISSCPLELDGIYGGGKSAYMEGKAEIELGCVSGLDEIYGGAENADVGSSIVLTLTSGHYNKVYGGNNRGGKILGTITVNIEQTGCLPVEIGQLYLGGNNAPYSVYGYNDDGIIREGTRIYDDPVMNLKSFKSIGTVFGGGEGSGAELAGNPIINVNVVTGWVDGQYKGTGEQDANSIYHAAPQELTPDGEIGTIFGGGNAAKVIGNTTINIGDQSTVEMHSLAVLRDKIKKATNHKVEMGGIVFELSQDEKTIYYTINGEESHAMEKDIIQTVNGATISGNVYGGGNQASVTGGTNINVGPEGTPQTLSPDPDPNPAPIRSNPQQPQQPQSNAATESQQTRTANPTRL